MSRTLGEWISGKVFGYVHGNNLVYNTCWEDPRIDKQVLNLRPEDNLLVITSAGCNALSYALTGLNHVYAVDMNYRQNAVLELKMAGIRALDFETFFQLFGDGFLPDVRNIYREKLRSQLSESAQKYWDKYIRRFFGNRKKTYYFCGTSGYFARQMNFYVDYIGRFRKPVMELLAAESVEEQKKIWTEKVRDRLWSGLVRFAVNRDTTLSMLGVPRAQRQQIEQYDGGVVRFVQDCLDGVFASLPIKDNYFWRAYVTGSYTKTCCPEYLEEENFNKLKGGLVDRISVHTNTVEGFLRKHDGKISRFVLLDHMDWLSDRFYQALVSEWDAILATAAPDTRIIWRSGGLRTEYIYTVPVKIGDQEKNLGDILKMHPEKAAELHQLDRVHTYGSFYIADLLERNEKTVLPTGQTPE